MRVTLDMLNSSLNPNHAIKSFYRIKAIGILRKQYHRASSFKQYGLDGSITNLKVTPL